MNKDSLHGVVKLSDGAQFYKLSQGQSVGSETQLEQNNKLYLVQQDPNYSTVWEQQFKGELLGTTDIFTGAGNEVTMTLSRPVTDYECIVILANSVFGGSVGNAWVLLWLPSMAYQLYDSSHKIWLKGATNRAVSAWFTDDKTMIFGAINASSAAEVYGVNL